MARLLLAVIAGLALVRGAAMQDLAPADLHRLQVVGDVRLSPDGRRIAYSVQASDGPGRPQSRAWVMDLATLRSTPLGSAAGGSSTCRWSPDGSHVAWFGRGDGSDEGAGLVVSLPDGSDARVVASVSGTNHPLPGAGERFSWSPDGTRIAFVSSTPGPETEDANGDPMVITRYLYKPTASEGMTRFNDNRRLHVFVADLAPNPVQRVRQLTDGPYYEHSIDWSPRGDEILFVSNREADPDRVFNNDVFAVNVGDGSVRRLTDTKSAEYYPAWSPDGRSIAYLGTTRALTSSETTMEDTHVWVMDAEGRNRREAGRRDRQPAGTPRVVAGGRQPLLHRAGARQRAPLPAARVRRPAAGGRARTARAGRRVVVVGRARPDGRVRDGDAVEPRRAVQPPAGVRAAPVDHAEPGAAVEPDARDGREPRVSAAPTARRSKRS